MNEAFVKKINIGCGYDHRPGYLNVDMDPACQPDLLVTDNDFSVLPKRHFEELLANDVIEHIPRAYTMSALLEWADLIQMGGHLVIDTSDILGLANLLKQRPRFTDQHALSACLFGNQAHPGDFHYTGFTETTLRCYVISAGFQVNRVESRDGWMLTLYADRLEDWSRLLQTHIEASDSEFLLAAYGHAFGRAPEEPYRSAHLRDIAAGQSRRDLLKTLFGSLERNCRTADRWGL